VTVTFFVLLLISIQGCTTTQDLHKGWRKESIPVVFSPSMSSCYPLDASTIMDIKSDGVNLSDVDVNWRSESARTIDFQVVSPVGQVLYEGSLNNGRVLIPGDLGGLIKIDQHGWLFYSGYQLPILDRELSCFLNGYWPSSWSKEYFKDPLVSPNGRSVYFFGVDSFRRLELLMSLVSRQGISKIEGCVEFTWGGVLGLFKRNMSICMSRDSDSFSAEIKGLNESSVRWRNGS
jgi:hypothetical protein